MGGMSAAYEMITDYGTSQRKPVEFVHACVVIELWGS